MKKLRCWNMKRAALINKSGVFRKDHKSNSDNLSFDIFPESICFENIVKKN